MPDKIQCDTHGENWETFVCTHLARESAGLGFNRDEPTEEEAFPYAWCDNCEIIRAAHGGWNEEAEKLAEIKLICSGCYERTRIRNTRTEVTLDDLSGLRWKCGSCDEWHTGPCLDFGYDEPYYWDKKYEKASRIAKLLPGHRKDLHTFLEANYCAIEDRDFFVRGLILLPIIGTAETFCWGVWGSLSRDNFAKLRGMHDDPGRVELAPMFSWLSNQIVEYADTLRIKMYAHIQKPGERPHFELQPTDHPLSQEYHHGIAPERVKEIMLGRLAQNT